MTDLKIRELSPADPPVMAAAFARQGWDKPETQYRQYLDECMEGKRVTLIAEVDGEFAGYVNILWESPYPSFEEKGIPEVADFNVLKKFQRRRIGTALMDEAERRIAERSLLAGIGVGVDGDFGPAQILYARRGYLPDGRGLCSNGRPVVFGEQVTIDYDLVFYLTKKLDP